MRGDVVFQNLGLIQNPRTYHLRMLDNCQAGELFDDLVLRLVDIHEAQIEKVR